MTIRQFARLCGCNPQTLRYYDRVDLLKPVRVDEWTGYRYYNEEQALDYVTVRNLQTAGFSIEEIRELLGKDRSAVCEAFDAKIEEQERRLREMKEIRRSYQSEMTQVQEKISKVKSLISSLMKQYDAEQEFGISAETYDEIVGMVTGSIDGALPESVPETDLSAPAAAPAPRQEAPSPLDDPAYEVVYEKHGWKAAREFLDDISVLEDGGEYYLHFGLSEAKEGSGIAFMNTLLCLLLLRNPDRQKALSCNVEKSSDGRNHIRVLKRK